MSQRDKTAENEATKLTVRFESFLDSGEVIDQILWNFNCRRICITSFKLDSGASWKNYKSLGLWGICNNCNWPFRLFGPKGTVSKLYINQL